MKKNDKGRTIADSKAYIVQYRDGPGNIGWQKVGYKASYKATA